MMYVDEVIYDNEANLEVRESTASVCVACREFCG